VEANGFVAGTRVGLGIRAFVFAAHSNGKAGMVEMAGMEVGFRAILEVVRKLTVSWRERAWVWEFAPSCLPRIPTVPFDGIRPVGCGTVPFADGTIPQTK
jgi:hypothetical protein